MNTNSTRCLPVYEDAVVSYSLRLPTYRSSYIRRYHPYARYATPIVQEQFMVTYEIDYDEPFLDLSILDRRVEPIRVEPTTVEDTNHCHNLSGNPGEEQPHELPEAPVPTADAEAVDLDGGEREGLNERPDQNSVFIRVGLGRTPESGPTPILDCLRRIWSFHRTRQGPPNQSPTSCSSSRALELSTTSPSGLSSSPSPLPSLLLTKCGGKHQSRAGTSASTLEKQQPRKQRQLPPVSYYVSEPKKWVEETADLVIPGEILDDLEVEERPIRVITDYVIFDPLHRNEMVSLSSIEEDDGVDRHFEGVGWVSPHFLDEDEGQEDEEDDEDRVYVKLGAVLRYTVDYTKENEDFYIETQYAWYILRKPAQAYEDTYRFFYTPRRVTQLVISSALRKSTYNNFLDRYQKMVDIFGRTCQEDDLWDAAIEINRVLEEVANLSTLKSDPLIRKILRRAPSTDAHQPRARGGRSRTLSLAPPVLQSMSDVDFLKAENQFATHVTPRISELIKPYVTEDMCKHRKLCTFINTALSKKRDVDWQKEDQFSPGSDYVRAVTIDDCRFHVGDYVVVSKTDSSMAQVQAAESEPPADARISDYFWFSMFKQANDSKSNLIFNALSYVDHYRPDFVYFENAQGFLSYALGTTQASKHRLEGGLKMGGLEACCSRPRRPRPHRFFLIAAREGMPLPQLPQPTHEFPQNRGLEIKFTNGEIIAPIKTGTGCSLHLFVTIDDAISDLTGNTLDYILYLQRNNAKCEREQEIYQLSTAATAMVGSAVITVLMHRITMILRRDIKLKHVGECQGTCNITRGV
ncbi:hypothetical protein JOM56_006729 [Amanita muscaria]